MSALSGMSGLAASPFGHVETYYVDATSGSDSNDGQTPNTAWQTIDKVNAATPARNTRIRLKRGEIWRAKEMELSNGGSAIARVHVDAYGTGANPIINGALLLTNWTNTVGAEYSATCLISPGHVYDDNAQLSLGSGAGALSAGEYFWVSNVLHVRLSDDSDPTTSTIESSRNVYNIEVAHSYLTFRNLSLDKCKSAAVRLGGASPNLTNITFHNLTSTRAGADAFRLGGAGANANPNNLTLLSCTVELWDRDANGSHPAIYQREGDGSGGNNLTIRNCLVDGWIPWGVDTNGMDNGIRVDGGDGLTIHNNEITGCDHGISLHGTVTAWDIAYNWIHEIGDDAFFFYNVDSSAGKVYNNVIYRCSDNFIDLSTGAGDFGLFAHNTGYECLNNAISLRGDDGMTATFKNNLWVTTANPSIPFYVFVDVTTTIDIDDFTFDHNLYYDTITPPVPSPFKYGETAPTNETWAEWQANLRDVNGVTADPDLVNAAGTTAADYKVNTGSPAIDAGETIPAITDDHEGTARPQAAGYDIGAFEQ